MIMKDLTGRIDRLPTRQYIVNETDSYVQLQITYWTVGGDDGLVWNVPAADGLECLGQVIVPVKEGLLSIPYYRSSFSEGPSELDFANSSMLTREEAEAIFNDLYEYICSFRQEMGAAFRVFDKG